MSSGRPLRSLTAHELAARLAHVSVWRKLDSQQEGTCLIQGGCLNLRCVAGAREQMIDAAERLASERGLGAMSLRDVMAEAGQRNKSAAQYHFGSREGLVEAVIEARMASSCRG